MSDADVIQGRLGWEPGDVSEASPGELEPHPKNAEIYGDTAAADELPDTFTDSIAEKGVLEPLVITRGKKIVSGHRRCVAAEAAGLDSVPVRYTEFDSDLAEREALIEFNRQRDKTPGQLVNEFEEMLAIEQERAKERQGQRSDLKDEPLGNVSEKSDGPQEARDKAAERVNADVSGRTLEKGKTVKEKAESDDEPTEVRETAEEQWQKLQSGDESFSGAYNAVKEAEREAEREPETETPPLPSGTYRTVVIDPPWDIEKIGREERPDQGKYLDYPTLGVDELRELPVSDLLPDSGGHLFLWTTQKHIPDALELIDSWGGRYECMMTWVKPTGVAPFSWQYNTEHVLFARFGDGLELEERGHQLSFEAPVNEHSEKPDLFFDRVRQATAAPRLNMFARTDRDGFDVWGDEAPDGGGFDGD
jgi:N6-adenosine-specific RNA methylase IME4/ParB-like chromosome segregation protein Spo0J